MGYSILDNLRKLDANNIGGILAFLEQAEQSYNTIFQEEIRKNPNKYRNSESDANSQVFATNSDRLIASGAFVTQDNFHHLNTMYTTLANEEDTNIDGAAGYRLAIIQSILMAAVEVEFTDALKALQLDQTDKEKQLQLFKQLPDSLGSLILQVDQTIAKQLAPAQSGHTNATEIEMDDLLLKQEIKKTLFSDSLSILANSADQLVENAESQKEKYPEESILVARLRLTINAQRVCPIEQKAFLKKLNPQLDTVKANFNQHRSSLAIQILQKIIRIVSMLTARISSCAQPKLFTPTKTIIAQMKDTADTITTPRPPVAAS